MNSDFRHRQFDIYKCDCFLLGKYDIAAALARLVSKAYGRYGLKERHILHIPTHTIALGEDLNVKR